MILVAALGGVLFEEQEAAAERKAKEGTDKKPKLAAREIEY